MKKAISFTMGALLSVGLVSTATAGHGHADDFFSRTQVNVTGHYTQPSNHGLVLGTETTNTRNVFVDPDHSWDWGVGVQHALPNGSATRLVLDYDHFSDSESRTAVGLTANGTAAADQTNHAVVRNKDETFRFGARHTVTDGNNFDLEAGAFVEYSDVKRDFTRSNTNAAGTTRTNQIFHDRLEGWGPSFDLTGRCWPWGRDTGFSVFGGVEAAFLYADSSFNHRVTDINGTVSSQQNRDDSHGVNQRFAANAGVAYVKQLNESVKMSVRLGGRWVNWVNAFTNLDGANSGVSSVAGQNTDYSRVGPFLNVSLGGVNSPA